MSGILLPYQRRYDILGDVQAGLEKALAEGRTYRQFAAELTPLLQAKGWWGRTDIRDPLTGQIREAQLGSPRRLRTIYDTNLRTAHAAGAWVRVQEHKETHPYLRYMVILDGREREEHRRWHGVTLPVGHVFWLTHYPPNGWRCRCAVMQLSPEDMRMFGYSETVAPRVEMAAWENARTGEVLYVPAGIDPGFAYNVGRAALEEHSARALMGGLDGLPPRIAAEAMAESARFVLPAVQRDLERWIESTTARILSGDRRMYNERRVVGALGSTQLDYLQSIGELPGSGSVSLGDRDVLHMQRSNKPGRWSTEEMAGLPELLAHPNAVLWDRQVNGFLYVAGSPGKGAPVVAVVKTGNRLRIDRDKYMVNSLRTTLELTWSDLRNAGRYVLLEGEV